MGKRGTDGKSERIAQAREQLATKGLAVSRFEARMAHLQAAAKRERERVEILVLGGDRPDPIKTTSRQRGRKRLVKVPVELAPDVESALRRREKWSHKQGTPETLDKFSRQHDDALIQLEKNGTIDKEQQEWAAEIANVHRSIQADVAVAVASLEARVDQSRSTAHLVGENVKRVRMHAAYSAWRAALPLPKGLVLDMIVGDRVGYTVAARRYGVHNRKAKRQLISALDSWPEFVNRAHRDINANDVERLNAAE